MRQPETQVLGSDYEQREQSYYNLDETELLDTPSQWRLDHDAVFEWAKKHLRYGYCWPIPKSLITENIYCDLCPYPRPQATHVSYFRDLWCQKHYQKWKYQQRKKPKSQRRIAREEAEAWFVREWYCCWHDVKDGMFSGGANTSEASCRASSGVV